MKGYWKSFLCGVAVAIAILGGVYALVAPAKESGKAPNSVTQINNAVVIKPLPTLRMVSGHEVPFTGKVSLKQAIDGKFAKNVTIVNFAATGVNAEKSAIKILWENGEIDRIPPGTQNKQFAPERRAVEIAIEGYSVKERKIFRDSARPGTLTWEIRYQPVD